MASDDKRTIDEILRRRRGSPDDVDVRYRLRDYQNLSGWPPHARALVPVGVAAQVETVVRDAIRQLVDAGRTVRRPRRRPRSPRETRNRGHEGTPRPQHLARRMGLAPRPHQQRHARPGPPRHAVWGPELQDLSWLGSLLRRAVASRPRRRPGGISKRRGRGAHPCFGPCPRRHLARETLRCPATKPPTRQAHRRSQPKCSRRGSRTPRSSATPS